MSERTELEEPGAPAQNAGASSLDQVREILFGPQQRELTRRLARTDVHLATQAGEVRHEALRRLDLLEAYVRKELDGLTAAIEAQRSTQVDGLNTNTREAHEAIRLLEQRVTKLEDSVARTQRDFRDQLLGQAKSFVEEVRRAREELAAAIEREIVSARGEGLEPAAGASPLEEAERREAA